MVLSYDEEMGLTEATSTLLVDAKLRREYELLLKSEAAVRRLVRKDDVPQPSYPLESSLGAYARSFGTAQSDDRPGTYGPTTPVAHLSERNSERNHVIQWYPIVKSRVTANIRYKSQRPVPR